MKKSFIAILFTALLAAFFFYPTTAEAQFKKDFLYKFQSRWADIAANSAGTKIFLLNESYSRIEEYSNGSGYPLQAIHGSFGSGDTQFNRPQGIAIDQTEDLLYVLDTGNNRVAVYDISGVAGTFAHVKNFGSAGSGVGQFNNPSSISVALDYIYIADTDNHRIQRCPTSVTSGSASTDCVVWGGLGFADGKYSNPRGVVLSQQGAENFVYVADTGNNRIQKLASASGSVVSTYGSYGTGIGQFVNPLKVVADMSNNIYVLDTTSRVQKMNASFSPVLVWTMPQSATGLHIYTGGNLMYVSELNNRFEVYYSNTGAFNVAVTNEIGRPVDMSIDTSGNYYITNNFTTPNQPVVQKFNSNFVQQSEWTGLGALGTGNAFAYTVLGPMGLGTNTGNDVYVADTDADRIQKYTSAGSWVYSLTPAPSPGGPGAFSRPKDVATESTGKFYVADTGNSRIVKFDSNGAYTWARGMPTPTAGGPTPLPNSTPAPYGITVGSDNKIYVADVGFHRIQRFDANGTYETSWGVFGSADNTALPQLDTPQGMAIDLSGNIYVADTGNNRIQRFDQNGTLATRVVWGSYGTQDGKFDGPRNVFVDSQNKVYVSETGNKRIQVFGDATGSAALIVTQTSGTTVSEGTTTSDPAYLIDSYTVRLNTQPTADVNVTITVSNTSQASVSSSRLTFTQYNWYIPQVVTVYPIHDSVANGTHYVTISHKPQSVDLSYQNLPQTSWADVTVTINDTIDTPGITFSTNTVAAATEGAQLSNAYSIVLNTQPTSNVTVNLVPDSSMLVSPTSVTFTTTSGDWNSPRFIHILPVHDYVAQGTHVGLINHSATSTDPLYTSPTVEFSESSGNVSVNITDIDTPGVTISESSVTVSEGGTTDSYTVNLTSKPTQEVQIFIQDASPSALVSISPSTVVFTPETWAVGSPQTVVVSAIHDYIQNDINPRTTRIDHTASSGDPNYNGINVASVSASITDVDEGGLLVFKSGGGSVTVTEDGTTDTYLMQLTSVPSSNVTVTLTSTDGQATTSAYIYTFTPANWNTPQYATASAVDDSLEEGSHIGTILHTLDSSDANFDGKTSLLAIGITDNDAAGLTVRLPNGVINIAEDGPTDTYYIKLNSQPSSTVTLSFTAENQATATPALVTFTPSNWNVEQEITMSAIQDFIIEGPHTASVVYTASSVDASYSGKTASFTIDISDDDSMYPGVNFIETNGITEVVQGASETDTYTITLTSKPTANVKIKIVTDNAIATTSAGVYWFTPSNWNVPQTVTVTSKSTPGLDADLTAHFSHLLTSSDAHYNNIGVPTVTVIVRVNRGANAASAANAKPPTCSYTAPYSAPHLFQITTNQTQATLYFTPIMENISYYFIAYGYTPGDVRFGASYDYGPYPGVVNYTVNMLAPGTTYYFTVRGGNGCATGPWSSSVKATTVGPESSALTTRNFYAPAGSSSTGSSGSSSGGSAGSSSPTGGIWLTRDLYPGSQGADVRSLQEYLNAKGFTLATSGPGSPGNETTYYGALTTAAVRRFQEAHFQEILSPLGYFSGTGICGPSTRAYINSHPQ